MEILVNSYTPGLIFLINYLGIDPAGPVTAQVGGEVGNLLNLSDPTLGVGIQHVLSSLA